MALEDYTDQAAVDTAADLLTAIKALNKAIATLNALVVEVKGELEELDA